MTQTYSIGEVARMAGLSVRTLHHYDELHLVIAERLDNGHRSYGQEQLETLQQVRFYVEMGFPLDTIRQLMADPDFDRGAALRQQRELLVGRSARMRAMLDSIELAILANDEGETMTTRDLFDGFDPAEYQDEAAERWSDSDAYEESKKRTSGYSSRDWTEATAEGKTIAAGLAEILRAGKEAASDEAVALVEQYRLHIDRWFYPCSTLMHQQLAEMYVADARFTAYWDTFEPGLTVFVRDAIESNAGG